jgi:hypothetical protein
MTERERSNTSSGKPQAPADAVKMQAQKLSRDSRGLGFRIGEQKASKCKPTKLKV